MPHGSFYVCFMNSKKQSIKEIKQNAPEQNPITLFNTVLSEEQKSQLKKGTSFVPTPRDIEWYKVSINFKKFTNKINHLVDLDQKQQQVHRQVTVMSQF